MRLSRFPDRPLFGPRMRSSGRSVDVSPPWTAALKRLRFVYRTERQPEIAQMSQMPKDSSSSLSSWRSSSLVLQLGLCSDPYPRLCLGLDVGPNLNPFLALTRSLFQNRFLSSTPAS